MNILKSIFLTLSLGLLCSTAKADNTDWLIFSSQQGGSIIKSVNFQVGGCLYFGQDVMLYQDASNSLEIPYSGGGYMFFNPTGIDETTTPPFVDYGAKLSILSQNIYADRVNLVPIILDNEKHVTSLNFDLFLPAPLSVAKNDDGDFDIAATDRTADCSIVSATKDGAVRIICFNYKNAAIPATGGAIMYVPIEVKGAASVGDKYNVVLKAQSLTVINDDESLQEITLPDDMSLLTVAQSYTLGDVNNDGRFTTNDISMTVAYVLGSMPPGSIPQAADLNCDGRYSSIDISMDVALVLDADLPASAPRKAAAKNMARSGIVEYADVISISPIADELHQVALGFSNIGDYTSLQFDVKLPAGSDFKGAACSDPSIAVAYAMVGSDAARVVAYSPTNSCFADDAEIKLFVSAPSTEQISITDASLAAVADGLFVEVEAEGTSFSCEVSGLNSLPTTSEGIDAIYDISGRKLERIDRPGFYIINNKKVFVK